MIDTMISAKVLLGASVLNLENSNLRDAGTYDWFLLHAFAANFSVNRSTRNVHEWWRRRCWHERAVPLRYLHRLRSIVSACLLLVWRVPASRASRSISKAAAFSLAQSLRALGV
jgi:hypothetical protein